MKNTIHWIFGGTAVGKKTYIKQMVANTSDLKAFWVEDGDKNINDLLGEVDSQSIVVRWQWSREHVLAKIAATHQEIHQEIHLVHTAPEVQKSRSDSRETKLFGTNEETGEVIELRPISMLADESRGVRWLALGLAADYSIPFHSIDVT